MALSPRPRPRFQILRPRRRHLIRPEALRRARPYGHPPSPPALVPPRRPLAPPPPPQARPVPPPLLEMISIIEGKHNLDPSIFSCLELSSLSLAGCTFPPPQPPSFVGFLKLTKLSLSEVELPPHGERQLEAMIAASPLLLELSLDNVHSFHHSEVWFVRGPNIRSLRIWAVDQDFGCRIGELPRLEDAAFLDSEVTTQVLCKTLEGIAHVESLDFNALMHQFSDNPPERFSFTFQNLRSLDLHACLDQISSTSLVFSILRCAPNLEKLEIEVGCYDDLVDDGTVEGFANAQTSDDIFPRLRCLVT
uniref:F-box/LRR-repeat protein 15/At3g58940/PEG3-like LRR domain-containing protein n=1 Tax=Oryza rufipogon TaxID=4529 RepID=A0A0E0QK01_ORYRU